MEEGKKEGTEEGGGREADETPRVDIAELLLFFRV